MAKMKFSEFVDLLLAALYEFEQKPGGAEEYFDLNRIAQQLTEPVPAQWVFDAAKVLEARRLTRCVFTFGAIYGQLTGEGRLYVEEEKGTGIIKKYHETPGNFVVITGDGNQVVVGGRQGTISQVVDIATERKAVFDLLDKIVELLNEDHSLKPQEKQDLLTDAETVRNQLKKREPNRTALAALLEPLSQVASISGFVANLIQMINS